MAEQMWDRTLQYGPNTDQVKRFLSILRQLSPEEWGEVGSYHSRGGAAATEADQALSTNSLGWVRWIGMRAGEIAPTSGPAGARAVTAAEALALRDTLRDHFRALYEPFHSVVPVECLEVSACGHNRHL